MPVEQLEIDPPVSGDPVGASESSTIEREASFTSAKESSNWSKSTNVVLFSNSLST